MNSKIFKRKDGTYTMNEFESSIQNKSVIPLKYSSIDKHRDLRRKAKAEKEYLNV